MSKNKDRWKPKFAERYYHPSYIYGEWIIEKDLHQGTLEDIRVISGGLYFETKEECQDWINNRAPEVEL